MNDDDDPMSSITVVLLKLIQFASRKIRGNKGLGMVDLPGSLHPAEKRDGSQGLFVGTRSRISGTDWKG